MTADGRGRRCRRRDADRQTLNRQILDGICHSPSHLPPLIFSKFDYHIEDGVSKKLCPFSYPLFPLVLRSECARGLGGRGLSSRVAMAPSPLPSVQRGCLESRERSFSLSLSSAARALPAETLLTFRSVSSSDGRNSRLFCESILPVATTLANGLKNTEREREREKKNQ